MNWIHYQGIDEMSRRKVAYKPSSFKVGFFHKLFDHLLSCPNDSSWPLLPWSQPFPWFEMWKRSTYPPLGVCSLTEVNRKPCQTCIWWNSLIALSLNIFWQHRPAVSIMPRSITISSRNVAIQSFCKHCNVQLHKEGKDRSCIYRYSDPLCTV